MYLTGFPQEENCRVLVVDSQTAEVEDLGEDIDFFAGGKFGNPVGRREKGRELMREGAEKPGTQCFYDDTAAVLRLVGGLVRGVGRACLGVIEKQVECLSLDGGRDYSLQNPIVLPEVQVCKHDNISEMRNLRDLPWLPMKYIDICMCRENRRVCDLVRH